MPEQGTRIDRMMRPLHRWVWGDFDRRVRKLIAFSHVEGDGGRDILRAAELTPDLLLRRLYLEHAIDELHHADLFRQRGADLLKLRASRSSVLFDPTLCLAATGSPRVCQERRPESLLAFLHVAGKRRQSRFEPFIGTSSLTIRPPGRKIVEESSAVETFHMNYPYPQLTRVLPHAYRRQVCQARVSLLEEIPAGRVAIAGSSSKKKNKNNLSSCISCARSFRLAGRSAPSAASHLLGPVCRQDAIADQPIE